MSRNLKLNLIWMGFHIDGWNTEVTVFYGNFFKGEPMSWNQLFLDNAPGQLVNLNISLKTRMEKTSQIKSKLGVLSFQRTNFDLTSVVSQTY